MNYKKVNPFKKDDVVQHKNRSIKCLFKVVKVVNNKIKLIVLHNQSNFGTFEFEDFELVEVNK